MQKARPGVRHDILASLRRLLDAALVERLTRLAARERRATALFVAHLAELDTRDLHLRRGYSSLFVYCRDALNLAEHEAYNRIEAARAARRFPVILERIASGAVHLTTVRLLAPHLTADNHLGILESARGKRRSQVEEIVARLAPFPEAPTFVRRLPPPRPQPRPEAPEPPVAATSFTSPPDVRGVPAVLSSGDSFTPARPGPPRPAPATPPAQVIPLAPDRYRLQLTIGGPTLEKLRLATDMLRHAIPSGDEAAVLDRALDALLADLARTRFAATSSPHPAPRAPAPGSRHIPAEVKRAVWVRDLGRCAFVGTGGRRCDERAFVEFHHVRPYAAGGEASVENIQLRCRRHNDYEARMLFGYGHATGESGTEREPSSR